MKLFGHVMLRVLATFVASALGVIGAGSVVTKDISIPGVYAGNPATLIKII
jgi:serine acetyltransferase